MTSNHHTDENARNTRNQSMDGGAAPRAGLRARTGIRAGVEEVDRGAKPIEGAGR
jgi:hypothetical protein